MQCSTKKQTLFSDQTTFLLKVYICFVWWQTDTVHACMAAIIGIMHKRGKKLLNQNGMSLTFSLSNNNYWGADKA